MDVVIAGGHGQIALRLARLLAARGDRARSLVRNPDHVSDVAEAGADAVVFDLEGSDVDVDGGYREAVRRAQREEALLELLRVSVVPA